MLPKINNWIDMMADELADMFNTLTIEDVEKDYVWDADKEEPIVGKDMEFADDSVTSTYSEKSEGSDAKTYGTDEPDNSEEDLTKTVHFLIPKGIIAKYVTDIIKNDEKDVEFEQEALDAIQTALEAHLIKLFEISKMISDHYGHEIKPKDVTLAQKFI